MPEEEAQQQAKSESSSSESFLNAKGWIIVVVAELLTVAFFLVLMYLKEGKREAIRQDEEAQALGEDAALYNKYKVTMEDLNYSIPMPTGNTATMAMSIDIVLGRTRSERQNDTNIPETDWVKFIDVIKNMDSEIRDALRQHISQQSISQLNSPGGQEKIKNFVMEFVNTKLRSLKMELESDKLAQDRVTKVLIRDLYIQQ